MKIIHYENSNYYVTSGSSANKEYSRPVYLVVNKATEHVEHECMVWPEAIGIADKLNEFNLDDFKSIEEVPKFLS